MQTFFSLLTSDSTFLKLKRGDGLCGATSHSSEHGHKVKQRHTPEMETQHQTYSLAIASNRTSNTSANGVHQLCKAHNSCPIATPHSQRQWFPIHTALRNRYRHRLSSLQRQPFHTTTPSPDQSTAHRTDRSDCESFVYLASDPITYIQSLSSPRALPWFCYSMCVAHSIYHESTTSTRPYAIWYQSPLAGLWILISMYQFCLSLEAQRNIIYIGVQPRSIKPA